jgi:hypothetical protein
MVAYLGMPRATPDELAFMAVVKLLPCCNCRAQKSRTEVHHIVRGNRRLGHFYVLPYCRECHRTAYKRTRREKQLWEKLITSMGATHEWPTSKIVSRS